MSVLFNDFRACAPCFRRPRISTLLLGSLLLASLLAPPLVSAASAQETPKPVLTPAPAQTSTAPAPAVQPSSAPPTDLSHYVIGADDSLEVSVWKEPSLSGTFPVRPDGMISLVLVGDIKAAGLTPMQLSAEIRDKLQKYVQNPLVTVVVTAVNSQRIYLVGEVGHVGAIQLAPGMTPLQAIAAAGGLSPFANGKHIYILRGVQGHQQKIPFNYKLALKGDNKQNVSLQPGDTIVVP